MRVFMGVFRFRVHPGVVLHPRPGGGTHPSPSPLPHTHIYFFLLWISDGTALIVPIPRTKP